MKKVKKVLFISFVCILVYNVVKVNTDVEYYKRYIKDIDINEYNNIVEKQAEGVEYQTFYVDSLMNRIINKIDSILGR